MKLDNRKNMYKVWLRKFFFTVLLVLLIIFIGFTEYFKNPVLGLDKRAYFLVIGITYMVLIFLNAMLKPDFVFYGDVSDKIIIRYYPIRILNQKKHSIEIPKSKFVKFETEKFFFGMKEKLILYQKTQNGIARYPAISLSAVDKNDILKIKFALEQYISKNQKN